MKKITIIFLLALFLQVGLYVSVSYSNELTKRKAKIASMKSPASAHYLNAPFNPNIDKIPIPCTGHDIELVYKAFDERKKAEQKDEFESTEQYQQRLKTQAEKPLFGTVSKNSVLAFVANPSAMYDADSQTMTINLPTSPVWQTAQIDSSRLALEIKTSELTKKKSIGQNAFGAKVVIEELYAKEFELAIHNQSNFETEIVLDEFEKELQRQMSEVRAKYNLPSKSFWGRAAFVQRLKMESEEARTVKDKIAALILVKPTSPYISSGAVLREATFKNPTEFFSQMYYVDVDLLEIWIYNKQTAELLTKIKGK